MDQGQEMKEIRPRFFTESYRGAEDLMNPRPSHGRVPIDP